MLGGEAGLGLGAVEDDTKGLPLLDALHRVHCVVGERDVRVTV